MTRQNKSNQRPRKQDKSSTMVVDKRSASGLHANNKHQGRYDFKRLIEAEPGLADHVVKNPHGDMSIAFSNPESVKVLNRALLKTYYGLSHWDIPNGYLCPPIPGRADYIHRLNEWLQYDLMQERPARARLKVTALDIGVGANCIYPIVGATQYHWNWVGSDVDEGSLESAKNNVTLNGKLTRKIELRHQSQSEHIFEGVIQHGDVFVATTCNPPFHKSAEDAQKGTERKNANLAKNREQRGDLSQEKSQPAKKSEGLNFGGQNAELWCPGGEEAFVLNMANESKKFAHQVIWFSTLLSKKDNIRPLQKRLEKLGATHVLIQEMAQGQKKSRFLAWSFMSHEQRLAVSGHLL
ncbi:23S rRNA (adenine(1618)-N(6))-methyltransferase RlmF [Vibrio wakamikoensis]|uniref:Ribosomal RNA large subunit methyltransferase F n=1 Tax=Vibrio chaetopteri TaxID=3016528 RepID=A0AAU8BEU0_9VIBR